MTSASALIVMLVGTVVGALIGLLIGGSIDAWYLALLAGFFASIVAAVVRSLILARGAGIGPDDRRLPGLVTIYAAVASLGAGSLALDIAERSGLATHAGLDRHARRPVRLDPAHHTDGDLLHPSRPAAEA